MAPAPRVRPGAGPRRARRGGRAAGGAGAAGGGGGGAAGGLWRNGGSRAALPGCMLELVGDVDLGERARLHERCRGRS